MTYSLGNLGAVAHEQDDYKAVRTLYEESLEIRRRIGDRRGIADSPAGLAGVAAAAGQAARGTRLWAAAEALREQIGAPLSPWDRERQGKQVDQARQALGEEAFSAAWAAGQALTWEQAAEEARERRTS